MKSVIVLSALLLGCAVLAAATAMLSNERGFERAVLGISAYSCFLSTALLLRVKRHE